MKKLFSFSVLAAALVLPVGAQTLITPTTLSAAVSSQFVKTIAVTSATNCIVNNLVYVDRELMQIEAVASTTLTVRRGAAGTTSAPHANAALTFCSVPAAFAPNAGIARVDGQGSPQGSCTRGNQSYLPVINVKFGTVSDCLGGRWQSGSPFNSGGDQAAKFRINSPEPGGTAYTAVNTNGTTLGATTLYCSEVVLPTNKLLTGIALLNGTTVGTDNHYVVLYDSAGNALTNSALAGAVSASASAYQQFAFTAKYFAVGPSQYFACMQTNGTTDTVRMAVTGTNDNLLTKGQTSATFGTVPALVVPTTFTTAVGPYVYLY